MKKQITPETFSKLILSITLAVFIIILSLVSCKKTEPQTLKTQEPIIEQDSRLLGGWHLDSSTVGGVTSYTGYGLLLDSFYLKKYDGSPDMFSFIGGVPAPGNCCTFWGTKSNSFFVKTLNNQTTPAQEAYFYIYGNSLEFDLIGSNVSMYYSR